MSEHSRNEYNTDLSSCIILCLIETEPESCYLWSCFNRTRSTVILLENQLQWYDDQVKISSELTVCERYIDEGKLPGTQAKNALPF